jgi:hypothetical protein
VALSADGSTALVGAPDDNGGVGASWVFTRAGGVWSQQGAKLTGAAESGAAGFGASVSLSSDGNKALVGGPFDNVSTEVGAAWTFTRAAGLWTQLGTKLTGGTVPPGAWYGWTVALSGDGNSALVGGYPSLSTSGKVFLYVQGGSPWREQAELTAGGATGGSYFGYDVALSADGNTVLVGGPTDNGGVGAVTGRLDSPRRRPRRQQRRRRRVGIRGTLTARGADRRHGSGRYRPGKHQLRTAARAGRLLHRHGRARGTDRDGNLEPDPHDRADERHDLHLHRDCD